MLIGVLGLPFFFFKRGNGWGKSGARQGEFHKRHLSLDMHLTNDTIYYRERKNVASRLLPHFNFCIFPLSLVGDRQTPQMKRAASSGSPQEGRAAGGLQGRG